MGAVGSAVGSAAGAAIGTALLPGIGTKIGSFLGGKIGGSIGKKKDKKNDDMGKKITPGGLGTAFGAGQMVLGAIQAKKADALLPPAEDPMSRQVLSGLKTQQAKALTGTSDMASRTAVRQMAKTAGQSAFNAGGPVNTGMLASIVNPALQNINETAAKGLSDYSKQIGEQTSEMAQRKSDLSTLRSTTMAAKAATNTAAGTDNLLASLGTGKKKLQEEAAKALAAK